MEDNMGILSWITGDSKDTVVTTLKSKGPNRPMTPVTIGDIEKRRFTDENGFVNKIVIFASKISKDR
tara:strand:+ start:886 stop:1086 length:201 start_codon:yes stop_codon:yes gene_type:complete